MTEPDNVIYARFNMKEECERHWKDGCEVGLKFGYRYGYAEGERGNAMDFFMKCLGAFLIIMALTYVIGMAVIIVAGSVQPNPAQEMVRVHDMREAYWR